MRDSYCFRTWKIIAGRFIVKIHAKFEYLRNRPVLPHFPLRFQYETEMGSDVFDDRSDAGRLFQILGPEYTAVGDSASCLLHKSVA